MLQVARDFNKYIVGCAFKLYDVLTFNNQAYSLSIVVAAINAIMLVIVTTNNILLATNFAS